MTTVVLQKWELITKDPKLTQLQVKTSQLPLTKGNNHPGNEPLRRP